VARLKARGAEVGLREVLLEDALSLRDRYGVYDPGYWAELSKPVDLLLSGESFSFRRYMLPDDHPARTAGGISDVLTLTVEDTLKVNGYCPFDYSRFRAGSGGKRGTSA
jgi:hypothetical protein